jgi:hypothetical protein
MLDVIDANELNDFVLPELDPATTESQNKLSEEISSLWFEHLNAKNAARATKTELHAIRAKLGEHLYQMKRVLVQPGRGGQWSSFLKERQIPRATADRLVAVHERSLNPVVNCLTESISEPTEEEVQKLFTSVWPKLRRSLRSRPSLLLFIDLLKSQYECSEATSLEVLVVAPPTTTICLTSSGEDLFVDPR